MNIKRKRRRISQSLNSNLLHNLVNQLSQVSQHLLINRSIMKVHNIILYHLSNGRKHCYNSLNIMSLSGLEFSNQYFTSLDIREKIFVKEILINLNGRKLKITSMMNSSRKLANIILLTLKRMNIKNTKN